MDEQPGLMGHIGNALQGPFRIKMGPGVVTNVAWVTIVTVIALASLGVAFIWMKEPILAAVCILGIVLLVPLFLFTSYGFASKHPWPAVLGGTTFVDALRVSMGAKGAPQIVDVTPTEPPAMKSNGAHNE